MNKHRIRHVKHLDGTSKFHPERRFLFFFWSNYFTAFDTLKEAQDFINRRTPSRIVSETIITFADKNGVQ